MMIMIFSPPERKRNRRGRGKGIEDATSSPAIKTALQKKNIERQEKKNHTI